MENGDKHVDDLHLDYTLIYLVNPPVNEQFDNDFITHV
jgi:hypothetical protein